MPRISIPSYFASANDARRRRFWLLAGIAFLLHVVLDPLVTYVTVRVYRVGFEANPFLIKPLSAGVGTFVLFHVPLAVCFVIVFIGFLYLLHIASSAEVDRMYRFSTVAWGLIILWGMIVVGNNLIILIDGLT